MLAVGVASAAEPVGIIRRALLADDVLEGSSKARHEAQAISGLQIGNRPILPTAQKKLVVTGGADTRAVV